jgi:hypothetical protein
VISAVQQGHQVFPLVKLKDSNSNVLGHAYHSLSPIFWYLIIMIGCPSAPFMPLHSCSCMSSSPSGFTWAFWWWWGGVRSTQRSWTFFSRTKLHLWWNDRCILLLVLVWMIFMLLYEKMMCLSSQTRKN